MSSGHKYAIEYFNMGGRAELTRAAFWIGGIPFDDIRVSGEEFGANKAAGKYPFGQLPVMYVDGECIPQSGAMARYAGRLTGLYPEDPLQAFRVDAILDTINDVSNAVGATFRMSEEEKKTAREGIATNQLPRLVQLLVDLQTKNGGKFIVGDKLTIADLGALIVVNGWFGSGILDHIPASVVTGHEGFQKYINGLKELDEIKNYLAKSAEAMEKGKADIAARTGK